MNLVRIRAEAAAEAGAAAQWYEGQRPGLGMEFVLEVDAAVARGAES